MIHLLEITPDIDLVELRKQFRKRLMTGGAVVRLAPGLSPEQRRRIFERFCADAAGDNVESMVLVQLALEEGLADDLIDDLAKLSLQPVARALLSRGDLSAAVRDSLQRHTSRSAGQRYAMRRESTELRRLDEWGLRRYFLANIGDSDAMIRARMALCRAPLPSDLRFLLGRDPEPRVRFAARSGKVRAQRSPGPQAATENPLK